jgi:hypothetical protein
MGQFLIEDVAQLIASKGNGVKGTYQLFIMPDGLHLEKRTPQPVGDKLVARITSKDMILGLTNSQWSHIEKKLKEYNERHTA